MGRLVKNSLMGTLDALHTRRSIRRYTQQPVPPALIEQLLDAATCAPSAHNRQPWRFVVIETAAVKAQLADRLGERLRADRLRDDDQIDRIERDVQHSRNRIVAAPIVIVVCLSLIEMDRYPDERRTGLEKLLAIQSVAACGQNLLLATHELGLGACWMCAPLFAPDVVREVLDLPGDWDAQALITLGYPIDAGQPNITAQGCSLRRPRRSVTAAEDGGLSVTLRCNTKSRVDFRQKTIYR
jgi:coenzyme F420-0:L-glutamate ligase / coenzyme F420-1:gamma-L-glutamate ligase